VTKSGRSSYIEFDRCKSIDDFLTKYPDTKILDFCDNILDDTSNFKTVLIGSEGGFSSDEKKLLKGYDIFKLDTPMVLRSESAVVAISSKILF
jgi:16S rRNA (uracil1498-N3)-methyltransferase